MQQNYFYSFKIFPTLKTNSLIMTLVDGFAKSTTKSTYEGLIMTTAQDFIRNTIQECMEKDRLLNPKHSLRKFAALLDMQPATLSSFLSQRRSFSHKMATKIFKLLELPPEYTFELDNLFNEKKSSQKTHQKHLEKLQLQSSLHYLITDPAYYAYLCLVETKDFTDNDILAARALNSTAEEITKIKHKLLELKLLKYYGDKLIPTKSVLGSADNVPNQSLKIRHGRNMEDAKQAVFNMDVEKRYFSFETLAFNKEDLPKAQKKINDLLDELILMSQKSNNKDSVYEFCVHYFPRSKDL